MERKQLLIEKINSLEKTIKDFISSRPSKEILSFKEAMKLLGCSRNTLDRLRADGTLKAYTLRGRLYFKHSEILAALEENVAA